MRGRELGPLSSEPSLRSDIVLDLSHCDTHINPIWVCHIPSNPAVKRKVFVAQFEKKREREKKKKKVPFLCAVDRSFQAVSQDVSIQTEARIHSSKMSYYEINAILTEAQVSFRLCDPAMSCC